MVIQAAFEFQPPRALPGIVVFISIELDSTPPVSLADARDRVVILHTCLPLPLANFSIMSARLLYVDL